MKRYCIKCKKIKIFSRDLQNSLICRDCLPSDRNIKRGIEIARQQFSLICHCRKDCKEPCLENWEHTKECSIKSQQRAQ